MLMRMSAENTTEIEPNRSANQPPFNSSMVFQTTNKVNAPNSAGKNLIQNTPFPSCRMIHEIHDVKGGTDVYPQAKCRA